MKALYKFRNNGHSVVALGAPSAYLAEKIGMALGVAYVCDNISEVKENIDPKEFACLVIHMGNPDAVMAEAIAAEYTFDLRSLVCAPRDSISHRSLDFFMVTTNFSYFKPIFSVVSDMRWRFWEMDQAGQSVHEKYRKFMNRISDGIIRFSSSNEIIFANKTFCRWIEVKKCLGLRLSDLFDEESVTALNLCVSHLRHGVIMPFTVELKNGVLASLDPMPRFLANGEYDGMLALLRFRNAESKEAAVEYKESRTTMYLTSLSLALNKTFDYDKIIQEMIDALRRLCGNIAIGVLVNGEEPIISPGPVSIDETKASALAKFCERLNPERNIVVIKDLGVESDPLVPLIKSWNCSGAVCFSMHVNEERIGCVWLLMPVKLDSMRERASMVISTGVQVGMAVRNALNIREMLREQSKRRRFYSEALAAVTGNHLILCEYDEFDKYWQQCAGDEVIISLKETRDVPLARHCLVDKLEAFKVPEELSFGMATCVSEAATNVVKYGAPGKMSLKIGDNYVRVRFDDCGPGIAVDKLPKAILAPGYSESLSPSLGLGFSVMLKLCSSLRIATGNQGTSLLLEAEIEKHEVDPLESFVAFK